MMPDSRTIIIIVHAPAFTDHDDRPHSVVHALERALPGLQLDWTMSEKGDLIAVPQRDPWLATHLKNGGFPFLCNDDDNHPVTITGVANPAGLSSGGPPHSEVHADLSLDEAGTTRALQALAGIAEAARAVWGHATPNGYGGIVAQQFRHPGDVPHAPPYGLPSLALPWDRSTPEVPHFLGWLNYWSDATAKAIGFPDPVRDAKLLSRALRTAGGWVVQLTNEPLDLEDPEHLGALKKAYERFPQIGGR